MFFLEPSFKIISKTPKSLRCVFLWTNNSEKSRRVLFAGYCAADAWPLRGILDSGIKPNTSEGDFVGNVYSAFRERMIKGKSSLVARVEANPVRMPYPPSPNLGSIYENQKEVLGRSFGE